ncbi:hypothetical protein [Cystobacter fuscus]|uniref:hypothetical protein n=1 Tax=Cystobacter fuscus TaxID=43 RepID=UPI002B31DC37|nr:hypothetical protein F0U63_03380 [Cystobacter fuscus]
MENIELREGEQLIRKSPANLQHGIGAVGGWLFLTDRRLVFQPHRFNLNAQLGPKEIALDTVRGTRLVFTKLFGVLPLVPNALAIDAADGESRFVMGERRQWADELGMRLERSSKPSVLPAKEIRLYPSWFIILLGFCLNFTFAGILSAINWKRLGERSLMRYASFYAALGAVLTVLYSLSDFERPFLVFVINGCATFLASFDVNVVYARHKKNGGARANLLWPALIAPISVVLLSLAIGVVKQ